MAYCPICRYLHICLFEHIVLTTELGFSRRLIRASSLASSTEFVDGLPHHSITLYRSPCFIFVAMSCLLLENYEKAHFKVFIIKIHMLCRIHTTLNSKLDHVLSHNDGQVYNQKI